MRLTMENLNEKVLIYNARTKREVVLKFNQFGDLMLVRI